MTSITSSPESSPIQLGSQDIHGEDNAGLVSRAKEIEELIDPKHKLPKVAFELKEVSGKSNRYAVTTEDATGSHVIAGCTISEDETTRYFASVNLGLAFRNKHLGTAIYKEAIKSAILAGKNFQANTFSVSPDAKRVWNRLINNGVAKVVRGGSNGSFQGNSVIVEARPTTDRQ